MQQWLGRSKLHGFSGTGALIVMSYFRPWTLRKEDGCDEVPYAGEVRSVGLTWQEALSVWCDGGIMSAEIKPYVGNFLSVYRVRPQDNDEGEDRHSSDVASDEGLEVSNIELRSALETRIGGKCRGDEVGAEETASDVAQRTQYANSSSGIDVAQNVWGDAQAGSCKAHAPVPTNLRELLQAARSSQRREASMASTVRDLEVAARLHELTSATASDVQAWLAKVQVEVDKHGRQLLNADQFQVVKKVADRVVVELEAEALDASDPGEPIRRLMHGGPGTGKSHVVNVIENGLFRDVLNGTWV